MKNKPADAALARLSLFFKITITINGLRLVLCPVLILGSETRQEFRKVFKRPKVLTTFATSEPVQEIDMLVLTRKHNETIHIGNDIVITIVRVRGDSVRIGIQAPKEIHVMRSELVGAPPKQSDKPEQAPKSNATEGPNGKDDGPLAAFLKVFPKIELATAS